MFEHPINKEVLRSTFKQEFSYVLRHGFIKFINIWEEKIITEK